MRSRTKSENNIASSVQVFSALTEMKFKPNNEQGMLTIEQRKDRFIKHKTQFVELYDPMTMVLQADRKIQNQQTRRLKFLVSLSPEHFIIGNQNQIDMIGFGGIAHGYVDTDYYWSLSLKGPIQSISVDTKKSFLLILSQTTLYFYQYTVKSKELPIVVGELLLKEGVRFIRLLKDTLLGVFYNSTFQIYNIENLSMIKKKLDKNYPIDQAKKLLTIPSSIDYIINIFFEEPKEKKQSFILWCLEIDFGTEQIKTRPLYRVYDIMNYAKGKLSIQNYTKDIIFMNLNHQIMAIKNGYLIDSVNVAIKQDSEILKYIHPNTILHLTKKNVEVYNFSIDFSVKPQKIILRSVDSMEFSKLPEDSFYISVLKTFNNNFAIFFQDSKKKQFQTKGQISYYFELSTNTTLKEKINSLFASIGDNIANPEIVNNKYNIAIKMGLTEEEIYLQLWNHSGKTTLEDYQYILATKDYKIIKLQIEKKLKKESMVLRQILRIQESCHDINRQLLQSPECTEENVKDFVTSHFFLKKLRLYKDIMVLNRYSVVEPSTYSDGSDSKQLKMDIQTYNDYKNADIKTYLIDQINDMLFNLKNNAKMIRLIIKSFKFVYRLVYKHILNEIIINSKDCLIDLLNELPEILPYFHHDLTEEERKDGLYEGIWGDVEEIEWERQLYPQRLQTIHNKQALNDFMKSVWFKRFWLTGHCLTYRNKKSIIEINQFNNSDKIFYFFISKLYEHSKNNKPMYYQVIHFLEEKYQFFPAHLKNKALLYENLYIYYFNEEQDNPNKLTFEEFLDWDDELLFKYFFDHQKVKKSSLLKEVKPIYEQSDPNGPHLFNIGLFSYFYSERSEISDIKFILNRVNNEKAEFHQKNKGIYEVLIKSIQFKMRVGSPHDIPMDEVMIYVQNILLDQGEEIMDEIMIMECIHEQAKLFQEMKINMTIKEIMENFEDVTSKIIKHKLDQKAVMKIKDYPEFQKQSVAILQEVERIKNKIYDPEDRSNYTLLVYLSFILQEESFIDNVAKLLEDEEVNSLYQIMGTTIENIVLYMYKWKFSQSNKYLDNTQYLHKLLDLLPHDNSCRRYLMLQLEIGLILSSEECPFEYPLSPTSYYPETTVIKQTFRLQKEKYLLSLNLPKLYELLKEFHVVASRQNKQSKKISEPISLYRLYEIMIVELLEKQLYKDVIPYIYKILDTPFQVQDQGIVYVSLYIYKTAREFNEESRKNIFKLLSIYFRHPRTLFKIIETVITTEQTGLEQSKYLKEILDKEASRINFNHHNSILNKEFSSHYQDPNSKAVIEVYRQYLKSKNQEFQRKSEYDIIFTFLCQSPYLLIKFIELQKDNLKLKQIYLFLTMTITRPIFHRRKVYEVLKRVFAAIVMSSLRMKESEELILAFQSKTTDEQFKLPKLSNLNDKDEHLFKIAKSFAKFKTRLQKAKSLKENCEKAILSIRAAITNPLTITNDEITLDEDDAAKLEGPTNDKFVAAKPKQSKIDFDSSKQKQIYFFRRAELPEFLENIYGSKIETEIELVKKKSAAPAIALKTTKDSNFLKIRNQMIERLYSHKVVAASEYHDQESARREDEEFLDSFLPKPGMRSSQLSVSSNRSAKNSRDLSRSRSKNNNKKSSRVLEPQSLGHAGEEKIMLFDQDFLNPSNPSHPSNPSKTSNPSIHSDQKSEKMSIVSQKAGKSDTEKYLRLREELVKSYNETKIPKFDITPLENEIKSIQEDENLTQNLIANKIELLLHAFVTYLYEQPLEILSINLKLIEEIARKHPESGVNVFFLQAYQRTIATHDKHGLEMKVTELLPITGIFVKSKDIYDLYKQIQPHIISKITDENVFKLSKLIALGFRKSVVEQQILFNYLKLIMKDFLVAAEQELTNIKQKIKSIIHKLQLQTIIERGEELFTSLDQGERRDTLLNNYAQTLKNKGYNSAAKDLLSKVQ